VESTSKSGQIVLHHLDNSRSQRIIWLLEELQVNYTIKNYKRGPDQLAPKELTQIHPLGKSPVITDGPYTIAESGAIIEYLVDTYGTHLKPDEKEAKMQYTFWLHYAEGSLMTPLLLRLVFDIVVTKTPFLVKFVAKSISNSVSDAFITPNLKKHFAFIESHLEKNEYFTGNRFSAADVQMSFGIQGGVSRAPQFVGPKTRKWLSEMVARDAYKKALEKGGKFDY